MLHAVRAGSVALALAVPFAAAADTALSLRSGWAIPVGDAVSGAQMNDWFDGFVPIQLDLDFRVAERTRLGVYAEYGWVSAVCSEWVGCSGRNVRVGVQATYALGAGSFAGWLGAGGGFEQTQYEFTSHPYPGVEYVETSRLNGWELNVQGGASWTLSPRWRLGPYLMVAGGRYEGGSVSSYADKSFHAWVHVGVRCTLGL